MSKQQRPGKTPEPTIPCDDCGQLVPSYDMVNYGARDGTFRRLCHRCFNAEVAALGGLEDFQDAQFEPVVLTDARGAPHEFHFRTHLFGAGVSLDAFEIQGGVPAGYRFQVIGEPTEDLLALLGQLIAKMRRALALQHIEDTSLGPQIADHQTVRGRIEWDEAYESRVPILVIDGREITWEEFGRMLMTFEGWQFKLEIRDLSEEV